MPISKKMPPHYWEDVVSRKSAMRSLESTFRKGGTQRYDNRNQGDRPYNNRGGKGYNTGRGGYNNNNVEGGFQKNTAQ